jgi:23S rRNA (adenine2503-C2)-methyltransferase
MGEPTFNKNVVDVARYLDFVVRVDRGWGFHPVVSTMMPKRNNQLTDFLTRWIDFKNGPINGNAGLQLSINTTDEKARAKHMPESMTLEGMYHTMCDVLGYSGELKGRKIALNFALTDLEIDAEKVVKYFSPKYFLCKLTPMHMTKACEDNNLKTEGGYDHYYPYQKVEAELKAAGFDVIVFVPSKEEDESRITCGNAILSDLKGE